MKNTLTYSISFSFKGIVHKPQCVLDLDHFMIRGEISIPLLYEHLARSNNIDAYSYEHDVLMMSDIEFESAEGLATEFLHDGQFDCDGFESRWRTESLHCAIQEIASRCMGIEDMTTLSGLKEALLEAIELGKKEQRHVLSAVNKPADKLF
ncbi:hypothetical protein MMIC_P0292 [Mariprofundus micogutta]|uniref:Uncharacterized protein n=1 Tax=Mariprofundus micogutta TaxID=1921010 RepID=A0A1L8CKB0_9PROT|nr:hypothetical protein [Mariprofundus micogutta]GAV19358.1 hypothetical protein MMIC_P0292 [Mariprofundus micogutta]